MSDHNDLALSLWAATAPPAPEAPALEGERRADVAVVAPACLASLSSQVLLLSLLSVPLSSSSCLLLS